MNSIADTEATVKGILISATDEKIVLALPHTEYQLHLVPTVAASALAPYVGKRVKGAVHAEALRIHATSPSAGGGRFIEPVIGMPRIVAGRIKAVDPESGLIVVDVSVPFHVKPPPEQDRLVLDEGRMVNFYVKSEATFTPVEQREP